MCLAARVLPPVWRVRPGEYGSGSIQWPAKNDVAQCAVTSRADDPVILRSPVDHEPAPPYAQACLETYRYFRRLEIARQNHPARKTDLRLEARWSLYPGSSSWADEA